MSFFKTVHSFLKANAWQLIQYIDLGMTAHVFIVEKGDQTQVLKTQRDGAMNVHSLKLEQRILQYLNETDMAQYVPAVGEWIDKVNGFLMEYLRYPTPEERNTHDFIHTLAIAVQTLHELKLPQLNGLQDDRPCPGTAISRRLRDSFSIIARDDEFWFDLSAQDIPKLELVRAKYDAYVEMLPTLETTLTDPRCVLTHGDLSGDNLMVRQDGSFALVDWGEVKISSNLTDVAYLITHSEWDDNETQKFLHTYFNDNSKALKVALPAINILSCLYRYDSCVRSLRWLNTLGSDGLDAVGRAYFERQLNAL